MNYMITYDLNNPGQNYNDVISAIKTASNGKWFSSWKSTYIIQSDFQSATAIFDHIKPYLDDNDRLFVAEITVNYQGWLSNEEWNILESTIF